MPVRPWTVGGITSLMLAATAAARSTERTSFDRDARPIFRKRCASCHNPERPRGELDLTSYTGVLAGGAGGKAVVAGAPDDSPVYTLAAHLEEPHMPPNAARIPQRELDVLRRWIEGGLVEKSGDVAVKSEGRAAGESPESPVDGLVAPVARARASAITAIAVDPRRPLAVVSGHKQVIVYDLAGRKIRGALPFPEGDVFALRFSRDGRLLLAAGGTGAESGKVAVFDAGTWRRLATLGDEFDAILAADLSPDEARIVFGGPSRLVKVVGNPGGEIIHTFRKPTEWVTSASFSPDGLLVAAGDRFGGLFLWETRSSREFLALRGHAKAVTAIAFLAGRDAMVTAGEDGRLQVWDLHTGRMSSGWEAHPGGVLGMDVDPSGRIASAGRDRRIKVRDLAGRSIADLGPTTDQATRVSWSPDGRSLVSGDCSGELRFWSLDGSTSIPLPMPLAAKPTTTALVVPELAPARPHVSRPTPIPARADRKPAVPGEGDDLDAALASARAAAVAAEKTVADLSRLARSRSRTTDSTDPRNAAPSSVLEALDAARAGLTSLRAALAADPGDAAMARAVAETERAVRLLEEQRDRRRAAAERP